MKISNSRFDTYLRCPYAHYLRYYEGLEVKHKDRPLVFGGDMHKLLQYRGDPKKLKRTRREIGDAYYALSPLEQQKLGGDDYIVDLSMIFEDYMDIYKDSPLPNHTEREFKIKVGSVKGEPVVFHGIIDEVYKRKRKGKKVVRLGEHKTFKKRPDMNTLVMNTQKCLYAKAYFLKTGILPEEVMWDHICSIPASEPIYLEKSKRFSTAATKRVTPYSFLRACQRLEITDKTVLAQAANYAQNIPEFFFKTPMEIVPEMVDIVWEGFMYTARDIVRQGHKNKTRHLTRDCHWCEFRDVCNAELSGQDAAGIIKRNYTHRDRTEEEETQ